jgi:hypothetical protein
MELQHSMKIDAFAIEKQFAILGNDVLIQAALAILGLEMPCTGIRADSR